MKTRYILMTAASIAFLAACNEKEADFAPEAGRVSVRIEQSETRTSVDDVDGKVSWDAGDKIAVHVGTAFVEKEVTPVGTDGYLGHIEVAETPSTGNVRNYYAVYPASAADDGNYGNPTLTVTLPAAYDITGKADEYSPLPLVAVNNTADGVLQFRHVGGLLRVYCENVPVGTRTIKLKVDKAITGTFQVYNLGASNPSIFSPGTATDNVIVYTVAGEGGLAAEGDIVLNVPVPCGTYSSFKVQTFATADATGTPITEAFANEEHTFSRHHGWRVPYGDLSLVLAVTGPVNSFKPEGETLAYMVKSYRITSTGNVPVAWNAEFLDDEGNTITKPEWLTLFTTSDAGSPDYKSFNTTASSNESSVTRTWRGPTTAGANSTKETAIDLSMQDIYGSAITQSTANCYVVSKPGWYKFPCVYGNALKFGSPNPSAYTSTLSGTGPEGNHFLTNFVRHDDLPITDPWITNNKGADNNNFVISSANLLWQDYANLISDVLYEDNYIYFQIGTMWQGNSVIAAKDPSGTILWSWHIWTIEGIEYSDNLKTTPVFSHPTTNHSVTDPNYMLLVNLGWYDAEKIDTPRSVRVRFTQDTPDGQVAYLTLSQTSHHSFGGNVFYQWGRKDPMQGFDENYMERIPHTEPNALQRVVTDPAINTLGYAIQHPNTFFCCYWTGVSPDRVAHPEWSNKIYDNLWNAEGKYDEDVFVVKTVYDPCPVGFKMPNRNAYTGFVSDGKWEGTDHNMGDEGEPGHAMIIGTWRHGFSFQRWEGDTEGIFFPATSLREYTTGELREDSYRDYNSWSGHYWSASRTYSTNTPNYLKNCTYLNFYFIQNVPRMSVIGKLGPESYAFSIRPVTE